MKLENNSGGKVWDLEAFFSGTAASIFGENLVKPAGNIKANAASAMITINFIPAIDNGTAIEFTFKNTASPDVAFEFGNWAADMDGKTIKAVDITRDMVKGHHQGRDRSRARQSWGLADCSYGALWPGVIVC